MERTFNPEKFKELVLYLAKRSEDDPSFGATKLKKLLFFSDFLAYGELGEPITGASYQKLKWGPAPRQLLPMQQQLRREGAAKIKRQSTFTPDKTIALREPDVSVFSSKEIDVIDQVLEAMDGDSATMVSDRSHRFSAGWQVADIQEDIPYETVFVYNGEVHPAAIEFGQRLAVREGWVDDDEDLGG